MKERLKLFKGKLISFKNKLLAYRFIKVFLLLLGVRIENQVPADYRPEVTVLIPAYNEEDWIGDTVKSVINQSYPVREIIVVDDFSSDRTGEIAGSYPGIRVLRTPAQTGMKAKAQKYGLKFVETELLVMLDADTILKEDAIEKIVPATYDDNTFSACGFVIPQDISSIWESVRLVQYLFGIGFFKNTQNFWGTLFVVSGCFSIYKTELLKSMDIPEDSIAEDLALTFQAQLEGYRVKFIKDAVSYPKDPDNWPTYKNQIRRWYRGFFQCLKMYKGDLLTKNKKLLVLTSVHLLSNFLWIFLIIGFITMTIQGSTGIYLYQAVFYFLLFDFSFTVFIVLKGAIKYKRIRPALAGIPFYWLSLIIDNIIFVESGYIELYKNNKLVVWHKGH